MPWSDRFEDPVPGFETLHDAATYIQRLPKAQYTLPHWEAAITALIHAAEGSGPNLHASVGMKQALNYGKPKPQSEPSRKAPKRFRVNR